MRIPRASRAEQNDEQTQFIKTVFAYTEDVWNDLMRDYQEPTLVLFSDNVQSACGMQGAATGSFYCPADQQVYIDLSSYDGLRDRHGAPGDFAQAYVIAHEVGHHIQNLTGTSRQVHDMPRGLGMVEANDLSVRLELQADFLAGVWGHHAQRNTRS